MRRPILKLNELTDGMPYSDIAGKYLIFDADAITTSVGDWQMGSYIQIDIESSSEDPMMLAKLEGPTPVDTTLKFNFYDFYGYGQSSLKQVAHNSPSSGSYNLSWQYDDVYPYRKFVKCPAIEQVGEDATIKLSSEYELEISVFSDSVYFSQDPIPSLIEDGQPIDPVGNLNFIDVVQHGQSYGNLKGKYLIFDPQMTCAPHSTILQDEPNNSYIDASRSALNIVLGPTTNQIATASSTESTKYDFTQNFWVFSSDFEPEAQTGSNVPVFEGLYICEFSRNPEPVDPDDLLLIAMEETRGDVISPPMNIGKEMFIPQPFDMFRPNKSQVVTMRYGEQVAPCQALEELPNVIDHIDEKNYLRVTYDPMTKTYGARMAIEGLANAVKCPLGIAVPMGYMFYAKLIPPFIIESPAPPPNAEGK
jgi:hypothetical protein